jgi:hypothetical protein
MKERLLLIAGLWFLLLLVDCRKEFSVNADYEDFPIVLGLLEVTDNTHYIKIYKSFVTEHNAYDAAKDIHLYSYIDSINVYMEERDAKTDTLIRKIPFDTTTAIPKDSGIFAYPTQIVYKAQAKLDIKYRYQLFVYNPYTKKMAYSQPILLAGQAMITRPTTTFFGITDRAFNIDYKPGQNAYQHEFLITFYYTETMRDNTSKQGKPISWNLGKQASQGNAAGIVNFQLASGSFFFQNIAANVVKNENVASRHTDSIVISIYTAGKDWYKYLLANLPSSGINQNRLDYTNMSAYIVEKDTIPKYALGLFSSRAVATQWFRDLALPSSRDSLFHGRYTKDLKFTDIY